MSQSCPVCKIPANFLFDAEDFNRKVTKEVFAYWHCPECELVFLPKIPDNLGEYYQDEYYEIPAIEKLCKIAEKNQYQIEMVKKYVSSGSLLEIGPAFGTFALQRFKF